MQLRPLVVFALCALAASSARATIIVTMSTSEMVKRSDAIIVGRVETASAMWHGGKIVTRARVRVERTIKPLPDNRGAARELDVVVPGGRVGNVTMRVIGAPTLRAGDHALMFVAGDTQYHVVGMTQGKLDVVKDANGRASVVWWNWAVGKWALRPLDHVAGEIEEAMR